MFQDFTKRSFGMCKLLIHLHANQFTDTYFVSNTRQRKLIVNKLTGSYAQELVFSLGSVIINIQMIKV